MAVQELIPCNRSDTDTKLTAREMADKRRTTTTSQLPTVSYSNKTRSRPSSRTNTPQNKTQLQDPEDEDQAHSNRPVIAVAEKVELGEFGFDPEYQCKSQVKAVQMATSVTKGTSIQQAAKSMLTTGQDVVLVISDDGHLLGILTDTDIVKKVIAKGADPCEVMVEDIMTARPTTVPSGTPCLDALKMMVDGRFRHIPVLASDGTLDGITDLPRCLYDSLATLEKTYHEAHTAMCVLQGLQDDGQAASDTMLDGVLREVMSPTVQEVLPEDAGAADIDHSSTVRSAAALMAAKNLTAVLITKGQGNSKELLGILTTKDICRRVVANKLDANKTSFKWDSNNHVTVMTPSPVSISPDTTIVAALHKMHGSYWSHLPVVSGKRPVGVVDLVTVSVYMADIIAKVKRTCTVQSLFSMWEGSQPSVVGVEEQQGLGGLGELDDLDACLSRFTEEQLGGGEQMQLGAEESSELAAGLHHHHESRFVDETLSDRFESRSQFGGSDVSRFTTTARAGMYKIYDGEEWHRFHFPSTSFKQFRALLCKKLSVDPLVPELLTIYYRDPEEHCNYRLSDNDNLSLAKEFGEHTGKDVELIAVLRKGTEREKFYAAPGSSESLSAGSGIVDMTDPTTKWAAAAVLAALGVSAAMWFMRR
eukprot:TRINITY_DN13679_c0_g1_i1.p1 TRINITY_DN13679_c0_g1~~TRINITY_DN13679_c0_g1_i1.p1  ORF type:complete len:647 (-),score=200.70 TRINITY_DN13679_c0_g1_i1:82-2022(-)